MGEHISILFNMAGDLTAASKSQLNDLSINVRREATKEVLSNSVQAMKRKQVEDALRQVGPLMNHSKCFKVNAKPYTRQDFYIKDWQTEVAGTVTQNQIDRTWRIEHAFQKSANDMNAGNFLVDLRRTTMHARWYYTVGSDAEMINPGQLIQTVATNDVAAAQAAFRAHSNETWNHLLDEDARAPDIQRLLENSLALKDDKTGFFDAFSVFWVPIHPANENAPPTINPGAQKNLLHLTSKLQVAEHFQTMKRLCPDSQYYKDRDYRGSTTEPAWEQIPNPKRTRRSALAVRDGIKITVHQYPPAGQSWTDADNGLWRHEWPAGAGVIPPTNDPRRRFIFCKIVFEVNWVFTLGEIISLGLPQAGVELMTAPIHIIVEAKLDKKFMHNFQVLPLPLGKPTLMVTLVGDTRQNRTNHAGAALEGGTTQLIPVYDLESLTSPYTLSETDLDRDIEDDAGTLPFLEPARITVSDLPEVQRPFMYNVGYSNAAANTALLTTIHRAGMSGFNGPRGQANLIWVSVLTAAFTMAEYHPDDPNFCRVIVALRTTGMNEADKTLLGITDLTRETDKSFELRVHMKDMRKPHFAILRAASENMSIIAESSETTAKTDNPAKSMTASQFVTSSANPRKTELDKWGHVLENSPTPATTERDVLLGKVFVSSHTSEDQETQPSMFMMTIMAQNRLMLRGAAVRTAAAHVRVANAQPNAAYVNEVRNVVFDATSEEFDQHMNDSNVTKSYYLPPLAVQDELNQFQGPPNLDALNSSGVFLFSLVRAAECLKQSSRYWLRENNGFDYVQRMRFKYKATRVNEVQSTEFLEEVSCSFDTNETFWKTHGLQLARMHMSVLLNKRTMLPQRELEHSECELVDEDQFLKNKWLMMSMTSNRGVPDQYLPLPVNKASCEVTMTYRPARAAVRLIPLVMSVVPKVAVRDQGGFDTKMAYQNNQSRR